MATDIQQTATVRERGASKLPERLSSRWRSILPAGDALLVLFLSLVAFNAEPNAKVAAFIMAGIVCGVFWLGDLYKTSYAVYPRDEAYYACAGILFAAIPAMLLLSGIGQIPIGTVILALLLCALGNSVWRVRMHLERRGGEVPYAGLQSITARGWHDRESAVYLLSKRTFDITVAALALIVTLPITIAAAIAIAAESGRPVFFKQERVGRDGAHFDVLKFRTMRRDAGAEWAQPGDNRITRTGAFLRRTSIDELPQLLNVLRGEMSIVGPRPEMSTFARDFARTLQPYDQRHVVAPGITGWAQVYRNRNLQPGDIKDVLPYDLFYVERSSVMLDTAILLKTIAEVLFHRAV
jgi:lipopolysaccharide/colanic/teichoic acid biosynthesis glycosyltransferase